ncbi:DUF397 domain-containing protein [Streptomyces huiliensis]|uniref:DUF397 domain-containing protein n=1 Tax=Streptomyces huiliensis TaxID=2876027 RepID=UPI001CC18CCD|nr:DUF397 domain-containing protein [Streptomyces huiliensis]MBZ4322384.1 DUF397 domain-containing protein [Streptomyces huiliensis]
MTLGSSGGTGPEPEWIKSSYSNGDGPSCVEMAAADDAVRVRDSKKAEGPSVAFPAGAWAAFTGFASGG